jgi:hypothetical protein
MLEFQSWKLRILRKLMLTNCIEFLVIAVKLFQGLLEKHMVMRLSLSLMSVKVVQMEKQARKTSTKNRKKEFKSVENICILTLVQSKEVALVDLNFGF